MQDLNDLYYFVQVVDHGGFAQAGRALGQPKSKLSRRIALLEERLGVRLIQRSTRHFSVTDTGQRYYTHCKAMLVEADAAQEAIDSVHAEPRGVIRLACPLALLDAHVDAMLVAFMARYPLVTVQLEATNRRVDVITEGFDLALRVRLPPLQDSDLVIRALGQSRQCLVASPELLARHPAVTSPADLSGLPSLQLGAPQDPHVWQLFGPDGTEARLHHQPRLITRGMHSLRAAAVGGLGIVQLPTMVICGELDAGRLVTVLPAWAPRPMQIHAVFPSRRGLLPSVRALIEHLGAHFDHMVD